MKKVLKLMKNNEIYFKMRIIEIKQNSRKKKQI